MMRSETVRHGLTVVALCLVTVISLYAPWRFAANAPILALGSEGDVLGNWFASEDGFAPQPISGGGPIVLDAGSSPAVPYATVVRLDFPPAKHLEVAVDLEIEGLRPGRDPWQRVEVIMVSFDRSLRPIGYWPVKVMSIAQDQKMRRVSETFPVHPETTAVRFLLYNGGRAGTLSIGAVSVSPLTEHSIFIAIRHLAVILWAAYFGVAAWRLFRLEGNGWMKTLFLALASVTAIGVLTPQPHYGLVVNHVERLADVVRYGLPPTPAVEPGTRQDGGTRQDERSESSQESHREPDRPENAETAKPSPEGGSSALGGPLLTVPPSQSRSMSLVDWILDRVTVKQAGHFSMFLLLALAAFAAFPGSSAASIAVLLVLSAGASEILQLFLATRGSSLSDFFLNLGGLALGAVLFWVARMTVRARRRYV